MTKFHATAWKTICFTTAILFNFFFQSKLFQEFNFSMRYWFNRANVIHWRGKVGYFLIFPENLLTHISISMTNGEKMAFEKIWNIIQTRYFSFPTNGDPTGGNQILRAYKLMEIHFSFVPLFLNENKFSFTFWSRLICWSKP